MGEHPFRDFTGTVADSAKAEGILAEWQDALPEVEAVSLSDGYALRSAWGPMLGVAIIATIAAFVLEVPLAFIAIAAIKIFGGVWFWSPLLSIAVRCLSILFIIWLFVAPRWIIPAIINHGARKFRNGDPHVAGWMAAAATLFSFAAALSVSHFVFAPVLLLRHTEYDPKVYSLVLWVGSLIGVGIVLWWTVKDVREFASNKAYCRYCGGIVSAKMLKALHADELHRTMTGIVGENATGICEILQTTSGDSGTLNLTKCQSCERGVLDVVVIYIVRMAGSSHKIEKNESWLAASKEWSAENVNAIGRG